MRLSDKQREDLQFAVKEATVWPEEARPRHNTVLHADILYALIARWKDVEQENERLRVALEPFRAVADRYDRLDAADGAKPTPGDWNALVPLAHCRAARAALAEPNPSDSANSCQEESE